MKDLSQLRGVELVVALRSAHPGELDSLRDDFSDVSGEAAIALLQILAAEVIELRRRVGELQGDATAQAISRSLAFR